MAISLSWLCGVAALSGCRNRAYSDLYIENMAAEIRDLEDQLYEYDHEYRLLEQELASLRQQNLQLMSPRDAEKSPAQQRLSPATDPQDKLEFSPIDRADAPSRAKERPEAMPGDPQSILESPSTVRPEAAAPSDELPAPAVPRSPMPPSSLPGLGPSDSPALPDTLPEPPAGRQPEGGDFEFEELLPPTIEPGEPMPPQAPLSAKLDAARLAPEDDLELNLSRISVPGQLAAQTSPAKMQVATETITDRRVVELAFHPSLSRAINLDEQTDDDGLFLVLQPRNESGQMIPEAADLSVVVLDPAREGSAASLGRWDYSAHDVKAKMQPIGSDQGIHLTLPWKGADPTADRVIVFARYTYENGRQVIGQKEIFISDGGGLKTVWAPRAPRSGPAGQPRADVAQATHRTPLHQAGQSSVVRPAAGSTPTGEPAPPPRFPAPR
ncbi:MAG: hypothetical protein KDA45_10585 [Planctomycetales bacterium]|nr:hypothetical protein [Planctomycetales bacterium]